MNILIVLACSAIAALIATIITLVIVYKADTDIHDKINAIFLELRLIKERFNHDLVQHNHRLNRHHHKFVKDFERFQTIDARLKRIDGGFPLEKNL